jgi:FAD:protein FMN transferase
MVRNRKYPRLAAVVLLLASGIAVKWFQPPAMPDNADDFQRFEFRSIHMGTKFRIVLYATDHDSAKSAADTAFALADDLNSIFSDYNPDSELSQLTLNVEPGRYVPVSEHMYQLLELAQAVADESNGAFDITLGPLTHIWRDFIRGNRTDLPTEEELEAARQRTGFRNLSLNPDSRSVALNMEGMVLDAGGIAKGYAAERMSEVLLTLGYKHTMIDAGGDIVLGSAPPGSEGWKMVIPVHDHDGLNSYVSFSLKKTAITTSGDLFQYIEHDGLRYSHIIDPSTGIGLTRQTSATVIGVNGATVDAWATALAVLGGKAGIDLLSRHTGYQARVEVVDSVGVSIYKTAGFDKL